MATGVCENCDRPDEDLETVHRVYVVPEAWDTPGSETKLDEEERWCFSCRSMYPHETVAQHPDEARG